MNHTISTTSCIILAGGQGKRVGGHDKGLVLYQGKPLIETVLEIMRPQVDDIIISANRNITTYQKFTDNVVSDLSSSYQGPLAGIVACLKHCRHSNAVVVACDMPGLPDDLVSRLLAAMKNNDVSIAAVDKHHQLALVLKTSLAEVIQQQLDMGRRRLMQWVKSVPHASVSFDDNAQAFINLNHLQDEQIK